MRVKKEKFKGKECLDMPTKKSRLAQMKEGAKHSSGSVFGNALFETEIVQSEIQRDKDEYTYVSVDTNDILLDETDSIMIPSFLLQSLQSGRIVNPVFLIPDYIEKEKAGQKYKEKTGKYKVIDGRKRIKIYKDLLQKAINEQDEKTIKKYSFIPSLVVPLTESEENLERIKEITSQDKQDGIATVIKDVTETLHQSITYCYQYEKIEVPREKLVTGRNDFKISQTEVDALEQSIYQVGLIQPIVVLPQINARTQQVEYLIKAGHKRFQAISQLIAHANLDSYEYPNGQKLINKEVVLKTYETIPALMIPMGASEEQIEKIYQDTNILSRHMTAEDMVDHMNYFENLPSRPTTKEEFMAFKEHKYQINDLAKLLAEDVKKLGFPEWKATKITEFLNIYYYGSDKVLSLYKEPASVGLTKRDLRWIATNYKDFNERAEQDKILEQAIENKETLAIRINKEKKTKPKQSLTVSQLSKVLLKERQKIDDLVITKIETIDYSAEEASRLQRTLQELKFSITELSSKLNEVFKEKNEQEKTPAKMTGEGEN